LQIARVGVSHVFAVFKGSATLPTTGSVVVEDPKILVPLKHSTSKNQNRLMRSRKCLAAEFALPSADKLSTHSTRISSSCLQR
jgi:hypothetical protein